MDGEVPPPGGIISDIIRIITHGAPPPGGVVDDIIQIITHGTPPPSDVVDEIINVAVTGLAAGSSLLGLLSALGSVVGGLPHAALAQVTQAATGGALPILGFHGLHAAMLATPRYGFLAARRYRASLGRVARAESNEPLRGAVVTLQDASGKPRQTVRTRADGTFSFLLPPGTYRLAVALQGFAFEPSPRNVALLPDEKVYDGRPFTVAESPKGGEVLLPPLVVAMRLIAGARRSQVRAALRNLWYVARTVQTHVAIPMLLLGATYNSVLLILQPSALLVAFEILYGVLLATELLLSRVIRRVVGHARDAVRKSPVALAIVRLLEEKTGRIVVTQVTSPRGSFLALPRPGAYRLQAAHPAYLPYEQRVQVLRWSPGAGALRVDLEPRSPS